MRLIHGTLRYALSQKQRVSLLYKLFSPPHPVLLRSNALVIGFPNRGGPGDSVWADMGTLLIVHFKVLVFPHRWGFLSSKVPSMLGASQTTNKT